MAPSHDHADMTRRSFIKGMSSAAVAATTIGPAMTSSATAADGADGKKVRMGVVGGGFGCSFYWHEHPNSVVKAVCDIRPEALDRLRKRYQCDVGYDDFHNLIKDKNVDAIAVFTPAPLHVYHAVKAMEAGKHVISAVPAAMTVGGCEKLIDAVKRTGRSYMMAETSVYRQEVISCRNWFNKGKFGEIFYSEMEYHHEGLIGLYFDERGLPTWRHGLPPMHYPTHCTGILTSVTGERFTEVSAIGWGDGHEVLQSNLYHNPFWNTSGFFKTSGGHSSRVSVFWHVAAGGTERGELYGDKMSFFMPRPGGIPAMVGYPNPGHRTEPIEIPKHYDTDMLPEPLRKASGHGGSHTFLTHEFVSALLEDRPPFVDVYEAVAYTVPGIIAHQSALKDGEQMKIPDYGRAG